MELPNAEEIYRKIYNEHDPDFVTESEVREKAMHEYARRVLDVAAEEALITIEKDEDGEYRTVVAKSSILRLKELLK